MSIFEERLAIFTNWLYTVLSPEALADAGFIHQPTSKQPDAVICQICKTCLIDWEPEDDPKVEHYFGSKTSKSCMRFASRSDSTLIFVQHPAVSPPKDSQASVPVPQSSQQAPQTSPVPKPSPKDIGFLDPSLQHDFPKLCLFHDVHAFCDRIEQGRSESGFLGVDILALLPKCLRGEALTWFRSQSECQDLAACLQALKARFPQQASSQEAPQEAPPQESSQIACQTPDYHHCKICNASFSSMARLIRHTQENICNKPSCRQCDIVFSSKNQLHRHLREECQKWSRSSSTSSSASSPACLLICLPKSSPSLLSTPRIPSKLDAKLDLAP